MFGNLHLLFYWTTFESGMARPTCHTHAPYSQAQPDQQMQSGTARPTCQTHSEFRHSPTITHATHASFFLLAFFDRQHVLNWLIPCHTYITNNYTTIELHPIGTYLHPSAPIELHPSAWSLSCNNSTVSFALPCAIYFSAWSSTKLCQAFPRKLLEGLHQRLCHSCGLTCFALQLFFCHRLGIRLLELDPFSTAFILLWRPDPGWGPYGPIYGPLWAHIWAHMDHPKNSEKYSKIQGFLRFPRDPCGGPLWRSSFSFTTRFTSACRNACIAVVSHFFDFNEASMRATCVRSRFTLSDAILIPATAFMNSSLAALNSKHKFGQASPDHKFGQASPDRFGFLNIFFRLCDLN